MFAFLFYLHFIIIYMKYEALHKLINVPSSCKRLSIPFLIIYQCHLRMVYNYFGPEMFYHLVQVLNIVRKADII